MNLQSLAADFNRFDQHQTGRKSRLFEAGHMKLLVLYLIQQESKHGYEIIKDIGELVGGDYTPSAGTIYPTLSYLEKQQYIYADITDGERKKYSITPAGISHLHNQRATIDKILYRFDTRKQIQNNEQYLDIKRAMENLKASLLLKIQHTELSSEQVRIIADKIDQAAVDIGRL